MKITTETTNGKLGGPWNPVKSGCMLTVPALAGVGPRPLLYYYYAAGVDPQTSLGLHHVAQAQARLRPRHAAGVLPLCRDPHHGHLHDLHHLPPGHDGDWRLARCVWPLAPRTPGRPAVDPRFTATVGRPSPVPGSRPPLDDTASELFWFLHVSDIHISKFIAEHAERFERFCSDTVSTVQPELVVVTGDLTDGEATDKSTFRRGTDQQLEEWLTYRATLDRYNLSRANFWLDMRGNHDTYGASGSDAASVRAAAKPLQTWGSPVGPLNTPASGWGARAPEPVRGVWRVRRAHALLR